MKTLPEARQQFEQCFYSYKISCRILGSTMSMKEQRGPALAWVTECRVDMIKAKREVIKLLRKT